MRVLTSSECLSIIKEREAQKKKEEEEKERRRREREEKKTQKAEEKKKKEEEKKRKEERRRKAEEKAEERENNKTKRTRKRKSSPVRSTNDNNVTLASTSTDHEKRSLRKKVTVDTGAEIVDSDIYTDRCCMCFQLFEDDVQLGEGAEWVQCPCEHWLHEDCVIQCIRDNTGKERLCPFCV